MKKYDVFISYSRKDFEEVKRFIDRLKQRIPSLTYWFDLTGIEHGDEFDKKIVYAINNSAYMILFLSDNAYQSYWVKREAMYAQNTNKKVLPVLLKDAQLSELYLFHFGSIDCISSTDDKQVEKMLKNLSNWTGKELLNSNTNRSETPQPKERSLVETVDRSLGKTMVPTSTPTKKVEDEKPITIESKIIQANGVEFKMIKVDGGTFNMGSIDGCTDEQPIHQVTLSDYYIAETQVTQEMWNSVMGNNPSNFKNEKSPVENVSWENCQVFIEKLNSITDCCFRLPTEAEWEYAARGGKYSKGYIYSGSNNIEEVAWWYKNSNGTTHPVKTKQPNELGIYDMSGNVWEWCEDNKSTYKPESVIDPLIHDGSSSKIERGGCWDDNWGDVTKSCRVSYRSSDWESRGTTRQI